MILLLCSRNDSVRKKWFTVLSPKWQVYQAASVQELHTLMKKFHVEILLLHRSMIDQGQLREICLKGTGSKVFVFADRPDELEGVACLQLGCVGYANTYMAPARLVAAIEAVESGLVWVGTSLMQRLIRGVAAGGDKEGEEALQPDVSPAIASLSKREYQIARLVADGRQNSEIAKELGITERTVKAHLGAVYTKTQTKGRLNLAILMNREQAG